jgi:hypothetical protein
MSGAMNSASRSHHAAPSTELITMSASSPLRPVAIAFCMAIALASAGVLWFRWHEKAPQEHSITVAAPALVERPPASSGAGVSQMPAVQGRVDQFDLPRLEMSPEAFANSPSNPFSCSPIFETASQRFCDWRSDHRVARSEAEARWMAQRGYPTLAERQMALKSDLAGLEAEAKRTGSPALWALLIERRLAEARSAEQAEDQWRALSNVAEQGRSTYALEQSALARLQVAQMEIVEAGEVPVDGAVSARVELLMSGALSDAAKLAVLGDPEAMVRVIRGLQAEAPAQYREYAERNGVYMGYMMQEAVNDLRRRSSAEARGLRPLGGGFTLADLQPRPVPLRVNGEGSEQVWVGER